MLLPLLTMCMTWGPAADPGELLIQRQEAIRAATAVVDPSIVRIATAAGIEKIGDVFRGSGPTTGLVVAADGWIVSSGFNLAHKPAGVLVALADGRRLPATVVATDHSRQLVLLKVDATDLPVPTAIDPAAIKPGQTAVALGRTWAVERPSVSVGIVSAVGRVWGRALQTDAKVSPVNYGGPLIDLTGRVYGVLVPLSPDSEATTAGYEWYDSGIGFAVPLAEIQRNLERWKKGDIRRGLLGVNFAQDDLYEGVPAVKTLAWKSPAVEAGLLPDDKITAVDGAAVARYAQFRHLLGPKNDGDEVTLTVKRGEEVLTKKVTLVGELPVYRRVWAGILPSARPADGGVALEQVFADSPAAKAGLTKDHKIISWDGKEVATAEDIDKLLGERLLADSVAVRVKAGDQTRDLTLDLAAFPKELPADLPAAAPAAEGDGELKPGTFRGHPGWIYRPTGFGDPAAFAAGVLILIVEPDAPEAAEATAEWKTFAQTYSLAVAAVRPRGENWQQTDLPTLTSALSDIRTETKAARARTLVVAAPALAGLAALVPRLDVTAVGGIVVTAPTRLQVPAPHPDHKVAFLAVWAEQDPKKGPFGKELDRLEEEGQVLFRAPYPGPPVPTLSAATRDLIGRWSILLQGL